MIAPFNNRYRTAWPFAVPAAFDQINTSVVNPDWYVAGYWQMPPGKICDLLTAKEFTFSFQFSSAAFNSWFGESFPSDVSYSVVCESGVWKYNDTETGLQTFNLDHKWDTQFKLFERYIDPGEESEFFLPQGFAGIRYVTSIIFTEGSGYWDFDVTMVAPIPIPAKDQDGNYIWRLTFNQNNFFAIRKVDESESSPTITTYPISDIGSSYLGINNSGGQGVGSGGCFPVASVSILTHFPA